MIKYQDIKEWDMKLTKKRQTFEAEYSLILSRFSVASLYPVTTPIRKMSKAKVEWA